MVRLSKRERDAIKKAKREQTEQVAIIEDAESLRIAQASREFNSMLAQKRTYKEVKTKDVVKRLRVGNTILIVNDWEQLRHAQRRREIPTHSNTKSLLRQNGIKDALTYVSTDKALYAQSKTPYANNVHQSTKFTTILAPNTKIARQWKSTKSI